MTHSLLCCELLHLATARPGLVGEISRARKMENMKMAMKQLVWAGLVVVALMGNPSAGMEEHITVRGGTKGERVKMQIRGMTEGTKEQMVKVDRNRL